MTPYLTPIQVRAKAAIEARKRAEQETEEKEPPKPIWEPYPGKPQEAAYNSEADIIGYGGQAGGGKSDLMLGIAGTKHKRSVIFRRVFPSLRGLIERSREIFNSANNSSHSRDSFNESLHVWRLADGRMIEFGAVQHDKDKKKHQGQPRDFMGFDEATEFPEAIIRFILAWLRTTTPGQKCQALLTFNPPTDETGEWIIKFFAPWLDETHPNPARDGELRWYAMLDGQETELASGETFDYTNKAGKVEHIQPKSRTFFHASLSDNPILEATGYGATLDALPEPLRSILKGNFKAGKTANPWQVIPTEWVKAAQARWQPEAPGPMSTIGSDAARGGADKMTIARLHSHWFAELIKYPGKSVLNGKQAAELIIADRKGDPAVAVDIIGIGSSGYDFLHDSGIPAIGVNFGAGSDATDKTGKLRFRNIRAECYWKFREALDPESGSDIALPPDPEVLGDLCAPRWKLSGGKIQIEEKAEIIKRLGRSPDCGDGIVIAYYALGHSGPLFMESTDEPLYDYG